RVPALIRTGFISIAVGYSFSSVGALRGLPPFPTRRSSDLSLPLPAEMVSFSLSLALIQSSPPLPTSESRPAPPSRISAPEPPIRDRKSTRLNSSHQIISYAVFCLKKKTLHRYDTITRPHPH